MSALHYIATLAIGRADGKSGPAGTAYLRTFAAYGSFGGFISALRVLK